MTETTASPATEAAEAAEAAGPGSNFIRTIIDEELRAGKNDGKVVTRFPPEPNGYLHIGHAKAICLNFSIASDYHGICHLRMDDTNPVKEDVEYVNSMIEDIHWLGFDWGDTIYYASDFYEKFYDFAVDLIEQDKAYIDELTPEEIRAHRGTLTEPGKDSPYRNRPVAESLDLFRRMRAGEFSDGTYVLRAKIDMASPNINMRDPTLFRIRHAHHHRTGDAWCIYPLYDFAHPLNDALEGITHSLCSLEFENHRPLYDWCIDNVRYPFPARPRQIEFARLNLKYTVMSKRKLLELVKTGLVRGWDDPRMPTLAGMRRRGYPPEAIRTFCDRIGVAKADSWIDLDMLEESVRDVLNPRSRRVMAVQKPLRVVIENLGDNEEVEIDAPYFPDEPERMGHRKVPFTKVIYIERDDFMEDPPKKFFRLAPGREVRLRWAYLLKCESVVKNEQGDIVELRATIDRETLGCNPADGRKTKGTIHWVSASHAVPAELRLYDRLFTAEKPDQEDDFKTCLNPASVEVVNGFIEPSMASAAVGEKVQFERQGYFVVDIDSKPDALVFNRIVGLRSSWQKMVAAGKVD